MATAGSAGSTPRSNRVLASVFRPNVLLVRRTEVGLKQALSSTTDRVEADTSESAPPITPATATGAAASAITSISGVSARSWPSSVRIFSPGAAVRTRMAGPTSRVRSNACIGWPSSSST